MSTTASWDRERPTCSQRAGSSAEALQEELSQTCFVVVSHFNFERFLHLRSLVR